MTDDPSSIELVFEALEAKKLAYRPDRTAPRRARVHQWVATTYTDGESGCSRVETARHDLGPVQRARSDRRLQGI